MARSSRGGEQSQAGCSWPSPRPAPLSQRRPTLAAAADLSDDAVELLTTLVNTGALAFDQFA